MRPPSRPAAPRDSKMPESFEIWVSIAVGITVTSAVFLVSRRLVLGRRARLAPRNPEDLPWEQLLGLLKQRYEGRSASDESLSPDELMEVLLGELAAKNSGVPEGAHWALPYHDHDDRRKSRRRWSNPVDVMIVSPVHDNLVHGLVFNRSTGGLAILTDVEFTVDTPLSA